MRCAKHMFTFRNAGVGSWCTCFLVVARPTILFQFVELAVIFQFVILCRKIGYASGQRLCIFIQSILCMLHTSDIFQSDGFWLYAYMRMCAYVCFVLLHFMFVFPLVQHSCNECKCIQRMYAHHDCVIWCALCLSYVMRVYARSSLIFTQIIIDYVVLYLHATNVQFTFGASCRHHMALCDCLTVPAEMSCCVWTRALT